jgi:uncharacterized membrane protein YoaT (DUF817 family)
MRLLRKKRSKSWKEKAQEREKRFKRDLVWAAVFVFFALYIGAATFTYRFKHPEKTETELMIDIGKILTWQ